MKILLVVCLLATAYAAPAERIARNILPGDPRYDPHGHHHHEEHEHHENEIETSKALQNGFAGNVAVPDITYGIYGSTTGAPFGLSDYFKYDFGAGLSEINPDIVNIGGAKIVEQSNSVTESSVTTPKVVSVSFIGSGGVSESSTAASVESGKQETTDDEAANLTKETKAETQSNGDDSSSENSQTSVKTAAVETKSSAGSVIPHDSGFSSDSLSTPFQSNFNLGSSFDSSFGSSLGQPSFGSGFQSFDQASFNPSFQSGLNANYEYFGNGNTNYPLNFGSYSGFEQAPQGHVIDSQVAASFPQFNPVEYNKNIGYLPPHSFNFQNGYSAPETVTASPYPSLLSVTQVAPTNLKYSQQTYLSPVLEQQQIFKNYNPAPLTQSTLVSIEKSIEPEVKINEGSSYSGITQLTDANGGYIY